MSSKFSNKKLAVIFGALLVLVIIFFATDGKNERTFRTELVGIDTASVNEILIYPRSNEYKEVRLFKSDSGWKVVLEDGKEVPAPDSKIGNLLNSLIGIKPNRLAARGQEKWHEFEVDSVGTRVKVLESGDVTLDIILGRFAFQQPRTMNTYVRLFNDTDVYEVEGFLTGTFNQDANSFRDNTVIKGSHDKWEKLSFSYPADSSFNLVKLNDKWFLNDEPVDSSEAVKSLRALERLTNNNFIDDFDKSVLSNPMYSLSIESAEEPGIVVNGYVRDSLFVIHSSLNPESYFDGSKNSFGEKVFLGKKKFIK
jgi:hypothetical protein